VTAAEVDSHARENRAAVLRERIYLTFALLAVTIALDAHGHILPVQAIVTLVVTAVGMLVAIFTADLISHLMVEGRMWTRRELGHALLVTMGSLAVLVLPVAILCGASIGWWGTHIALQIASFALLLTLVVHGWIAIRRLPLRWWQRLLTLTSEALLGLLVIFLQTLAHG
jgi:hypothetical protein